MGMRLYLVHYCDPIIPPTQSKGMTRSAFSGSKTRGATRGGGHKEEQVHYEMLGKKAEDRMRTSTWELRRKGKIIDKTSVEDLQIPPNDPDRIALVWQDISEADETTIEVDMPAKESMAPYYPYPFISYHKLVADPNTQQNIINTLPQGEWLIGPTAVGALLECSLDMSCKKGVAANYVLLTEHQLRALNGPVLASNSSFRWWYYDGDGFDPHGLFMGTPRDIALGKAYWEGMDDQDECTRALKFAPSRVALEKTSEGSGARQVVTSGDLSVSAGSGSSEVRYGTRPMGANLLPPGLYMVTLIELPGIETSIANVYESVCFCCLSEPATCVAMPCRHAISCQTCKPLVPAHVLAKCPTCRGRVECILDGEAMLNEDSDADIEMRDEAFDEFDKPDKPNDAAFAVGPV